MIIILFLWIVLCIYGIRLNETGRLPLELNQSIVLRGICAIEIMIGHVGLMTGSNVLYPNRKAGILFVGIFFMLSGYGVAYGVSNKKGYLRGFLVRRTWRLLLPAYLVYILYEIILVLMYKESGWAALFDINMFCHSINWYVWEQLLLYVVFWILYRIIPYRADIFMMVLSVFFVGSAYAAGADNPCYGSTLCFALGIFYYKYEKIVVKAIKEHFVWIFIVFGFVLILSMAAFFILGDANILGNPVARNIASLSFCVIALLVLSRYTIGNKVSYFLGKCSYEIFIIHPFVLALLSRMSFAWSFVYGFASVGVSIGLAVVLHYAIMQIINLYGKRDS